ncbi:MULTISPECIES: hypothetical protein [Sphingobium]|uniref:hypothetical protein n=1 Tax=Sphingobium TaxID=165695 RepID=UPI0015EBB6F2|nr:MULTISPECIES: hypothetical protein [Sphingobium]MCW2361540.1 hypothetical protein [Sphingobium sp. B10D3B]MCW2401781.1 hypothetical protein [Sphingobium sp. B10D7B]MCW2408760.1 hypothetical protein [Sphingobium xanthum]
MAIRSISRRSRNHAQRAGRALAPLPHPSWRLAPAAPHDSPPLASASDFWSRLGL